MKVKLVPLTAHGKENLKAQGELYQVVQALHSVQCLEGQPGYLLKSLKTGNQRWLLQKNSRHYQIEILDE